MRYLILIQSNERSMAVWDKLTDDQRMQFGLAHMALRKELTESGHLVASGGLEGPERAVRVSVREVAIHTTDGPFVEAKEYLAGFVLVECDSLDEAVRIAARVPDAANTEVEVRPLQDLRWLEEQL